MASGDHGLFSQMVICMCVCAYKIVAQESDDHELFLIDFNNTLKKFQLVSSITPILQLGCGHRKMSPDVKLNWSL
jgi:hypothetical protein